MSGQDGGETSLAEVLGEHFSPRAHDPADADLARGLYQRLDRAATEMMATVARPAGAAALRLTKGVISSLVDCERYASETLGQADDIATAQIAYGNLLGSLVTFDALGAVPDDLLRVPAVEPRAAQDAVGPVGPDPEQAKRLVLHGLDLVRANRTDRLDPVIEFVETLPDGRRAAFELELASRYEALVAGWPRFEPDWWPRVEESARMRLAGDTVLLSGRFDVAVGGAPSAFPLVVIEVKSGRWQDEFAEDHRLYALLATIRDRVLPSAVVTCSVEPAGEGTHRGSVNAEVVTHELLEDAAARVERALNAAGRLLRGEAAAERLCNRCWYCTVRDDCATFEAAR
jgi:hypothetical protein